MDSISAWGLYQRTEPKTRVCMQDGEKWSQGTEVESGETETRKGGELPRCPQAQPCRCDADSILLGPSRAM